MFKVQMNRNAGVGVAGFHLLLLVGALIAAAAASAASASAFSFSSRCSRKTLYSSADKLKDEEGKEYSVITRKFNLPKTQFT